MIHRQDFITDLFRAKGFLNKFTDIEFEDFKTFIRCKVEQYFALDRKLLVHIPINSVLEFEQFADAITRSYMTDKVSINLLIKSELLDDVFPLCEGLRGQFEITTDLEVKDARLFNKIKGFKQWTMNNPLWVDLKINYDNYKLVPRQIAHTFTTKYLRHFKLSFDYESLEKLTFNELHEFENWMYMITNWVISTGNKREHRHPIEIDMRRNKKPVYITSDLKMYAGKQAFEDNELLFDLEKRKNDNGESIPNKELNRLRQYIDLKPEIFTIPILRNYFLDLYQNKKVMGTYNQVPHLVRIVGEIFGRI